MNKRGLSAIITTMLVVLLVLVAIGIVWGVIRNIIRGGEEEIGVSAKCLHIDVRAIAVNCNNPEACVVTFERTGTDNDAIGGVKLIFFNETGNSGVIDKAGNIEKLAGKTITDLDSTLDAPDKLEVTVYLEDASGNEQLCDAQTTSTNIDVGVGGGDVEPNGEGPPNGGGEGICGDYEINTPNSEGLDEECEGGTGCTDCICDVGYDPASPLGLDCVRDPLMQCSGDIADWDPLHEECDGGADCIVPGGEPPGQPNECTCPEGYDPDEAGGCIQRLALVAGTVDEVWPIDAVMYFASDSLPTEEGDDIKYSSGYYVKFPGSSEPDCLLIANYVLPFGTYTRSHIAFNSEANILVGDTYEIWGDSTCA